jgi:acyl carrier protein phosphodiesterase
MNYLAHAYLSFEDTDVLAGNMMSDYVKGKTQYNYPPAVQRGIRLHRAIDAFTDQHEATRNIAALFKPHYRLYAGAFTDIVTIIFWPTMCNVLPTKLRFKFLHKTPTLH